MSIRPAISVVIPLYNKAAYVSRALESIRRQTWADFEAVIVDDGSTDDGGAIAAHFGDPRFRTVRQPNRGPGAARNRGIAEARADLVAFLDADDAWEPLFLEAVAALATRYPAAGILGTGYLRRFASGPDIEVTARVRRPDHSLLISDYFRAVRQGDLITASSVALRRAVLARLGGFPEGELMGEDRDLWARAALFYPVAYDTRILAVYHSEAEGRSCDLVGAVRRYPPAVRSLRALVIGGGLSRTQTGQAQCYSDWLLLKHAYQIVYDGDRTPLRDFLRAERFVSLRCRLEARALYVASTVLPLRLIAAFKLKPSTLLSSMRQNRAFASVLALADSLLGHVVVRRTSGAGPRSLARQQLPEHTTR
jgi:glycosyltransferase involved in cell wall biosynthesis